MKSPKNKTIDFPLSQASEYVARCVSADSDFSQMINKTVLADSFAALDAIPAESVDLVIADPYYNIDKNFHGNNYRRQQFDNYVAYTDSWLQKVAEKLKPNGSIYICCDWKSSSAIESVLHRYFIVQNRITWQREKGRGAKTNWKNAMEDIWFATKSNKYTFNIDAVKIRKKVLAPYKIDGKPKDWEETEHGNFRNTFPSNFWDDISIPYWSMPENTAHPTQKPEKLIAKLILASSNQGDLILDPFLGSGTTSVVAKKLGRQFVGIEQNPLYCAWAEFRLEQATENSEIQGFSDGIFWERNSFAEQNQRTKKTAAKNKN